MLYAFQLFATSLAKLFPALDLWLRWKRGRENEAPKLTCNGDHRRIHLAMLTVTTLNILLLVFVKMHQTQPKRCRRERDIYQVLLTRGMYTLFTWKPWKLIHSIIIIIITLSSGKLQCRLPNEELQVAKLTINIIFASYRWIQSCTFIMSMANVRRTSLQAGQEHFDLFCRKRRLREMRKSSVRHKIPKQLYRRCKNTYDRRSGFSPTS